MIKPLLFFLLSLFTFVSVFSQKPNSETDSLFAIFDKAPVQKKATIWRFKNHKIAIFALINILCIFLSKTTLCQININLFKKLVCRRLTEARIANPR
jgi:Fe-S-cluster containining protein